MAFRMHCVFCMSYRSMKVTKDRFDLPCECDCTSHHFVASGFPLDSCEKITSSLALVLTPNLSFFSHFDDATTNLSSVVQDTT